MRIVEAEQKSAGGSKSGRNKMVNKSTDFKQLYSSPMFYCTVSSLLTPREAHLNKNLITDRCLYFTNT